MDNTKYLYGIIGLLVGALIITGFVAIDGRSEYDRMGWKKLSRQENYQTQYGFNSMGGMMHGMMSGLSGKTGDEFDKAFLAEMIIHHQGAVNMAEAVLRTSKRQDLIDLANAIISAQNKEIEMMKNWQKSWFQQQ